MPPLATRPTCPSLAPGSTRDLALRALIPDRVLARRGSCQMDLRLSDSGCESRLSNCMAITYVHRISLCFEFNSIFNLKGKILPGHHASLLIRDHNNHPHAIVNTKHTRHPHHEPLSRTNPLLPHTNPHGPPPTTTPRSSQLPSSPIPPPRCHTQTRRGSRPALCLRPHRLRAPQDLTQPAAHPAPSPNRTPQLQASI